MPDYKKMYLTLVDEISNTIDQLKSALEKAEEFYVKDDDKETEKAATE